MGNPGFFLVDRDRVYMVYWVEKERTNDKDGKGVEQGTWDAQDHAG